MTDVEPAVAKQLLTDTGKTSPLTDLSSPSPPYFKNDSFDDNTETNPTTRDSQHNEGDESGKEEDTTVTKSKDTHGATALDPFYESSDLSDLDSEAETEKMFNANNTQKESDLSKMAKSRRRSGTADETVRRRRLDDDSPVHAEDTLNEEEADDNTLIKEGVIDELQNGQESDIEMDSNEEDISKVVKDIRKSEEADSSLSNTSTTTAATSTNGVDSSMTSKKGKRKMKDENSQELNGVKRHKTSDDDTVDAHLRNGSTENAGENEAEDEGDEDEEEEPEEEEEEEEEVELTEEQKQQKLLEAEAELEKQKQRKEAIQFLTEIEIDFAKLRDRLYEDKMGRFKSELEMCLDGTHPELQSVYSKIDSHREEKIRLSSLNQKYKLGCIDRQVRAQRTVVHQQFYKKASDYKTNYIREVMTKWDQVQKDRQEMDSNSPIYKYKVPEFVDELVMQRAQVNQEISNLVGLSMYYGFPTAPKLNSVNEEELGDDLKAMNIPLTKT